MSSEILFFKYLQLERNGRDNKNDEGRTNFLLHCNNRLLTLHRSKVFTQLSNTHAREKTNVRENIKKSLKVARSKQARVVSFLTY